MGEGGPHKVTYSAIDRSKSHVAKKTHSMARSTDPVSSHFSLGKTPIATGNLPFTGR